MIPAPYNCTCRYESPQVTAPQRTYHCDFCRRQEGMAHERTVNRREDVRADYRIPTRPPNRAERRRMAALARRRR